MHQYLNAIGFGSMKSKKELYEILDKVEQQYTCHELVYQDEELDFCEYQKEFGPGMGICLCGDMDSVDNFTKRYYYPYYRKNRSGRRSVQIYGIYRGRDCQSDNGRSVYYGKHGD